MSVGCHVCVCVWGGEMRYGGRGRGVMCGLRVVSMKPPRHVSRKIQSFLDGVEYKRIRCRNVQD